MTHYKSCHTSLKKVAVIAGEVNDHTVNLTWGGDLLRRRALSNDCTGQFGCGSGNTFDVVSMKDAAPRRRDATVKGLSLALIQSPIGSLLLLLRLSEDTVVLDCSLCGNALTSCDTHAHPYLCFLSHHHFVLCG